MAIKENYKEEMKCIGNHLIYLYSLCGSNEIMSMKAHLQVPI